MPGGVALFDANNDGRLDVFLTNGARQPDLVKSSQLHWNRLFLQTADGRFEDATDRAGLAGSGYSMGAAAADFDGDGWTDLFVTGVGVNLLYRNRGEGRFESVPFPPTGWSISAGWFDYDRDGDLDLFVVNYVVYDRDKEPYCGDLKAGYRTYCHPRHYLPVTNSLFRNDGGRFTDVSRSSGIARYPGKGMALAFEDYDGDGWLDVAVTSDTTPNFLFRNRADGTFEEAGEAAGVALNDDGRAVSSMGADFRDIDNDGRPDLFITALANETFPLFRGLKGGLFADITYPSRIGAITLPMSGWSTGIFDFDNDGLKDIFCANGDVNDNTERFSSRRSRQQNAVLWNEGGTFRLDAFGEAAQHRGAAFGDLDGDGGVDVVVSRLGEAPLIWMNRAGRGRRWLRVAAPLGSAVRVEAAGRTQWNRVTQAVGYASSSEPVAHFGLADAALVDLVEVVRADGRRQQWRAVRAGQTIRVDR